MVFGKIARAICIWAQCLTEFKDTGFDSLPDSYTWAQQLAKPEDVGSGSSPDPQGCLGSTLDEPKDVGLSPCLWFL
jgi:hypothetical protein